MIAKPSIAFNDFSGSAKAVTASSVHGRTILSSKAYHSNIITPAQAVSRNSLSKISRAYKQLSDSQMKSWESLALHLKSKSSLGYSTTLTAHNAFVRINSNRQMLGQSLLQTAPDYSNTIPAVIYGDIWVTTKRVLISGIVAPNSDYKLVVKMSAGQSIGVSSGWDKTVIITPGMSGDWGDVPLTKLYNEKIGFLPKENDKVFIEMYWIDPDLGMTGDAARTSAICTSEASAKEEGLEERTQFTTEMIDNDKADIVDIDIEIPGGTSQLVAEGSFDIQGYGSYFNVTTIETPETILRGGTMVFSRSSQRPDFKPGLASVIFEDVWKDGKKQQNIGVAHRAGGYDKQCEIFGSNPLMSFNV